MIYLYQKYVEHTKWSFKENKLFENALAQFNLDSPDLFENIASRLPGKTIQQIKTHYEALLKDIEMIESDHIPISDYETLNNECKSTPAPQNKSTHRQRKKGVFWTDEEHRNFLIELERYGKGDWRSISRHCVKSRTPTQVASHAQKYFLNLEKYASCSSKDAPPSHLSASTTASIPPNSSYNLG